MPKKILSQKERVRKYLDSGKTLTRLNAWEKLGIIELPARICALKDEGYQIKTKMVGVKNRFGETVRVARWSKA
jgi:hypothetical protein